MKMCFWNIIKGQIKFHFIGILVRKIIFTMAQLWAKGTIVPFFKDKFFKNLMMHRIDSFSHQLSTGLLQYSSDWSPSILASIKIIFLKAAIATHQKYKLVLFVYFKLLLWFFPFNYLILLSCLQINHKFPSYGI